MSFIQRIKEFLFGKPKKRSIETHSQYQESKSSEDIPIDDLLEIQISEQIRIANLWKDHWREYLIEEHRFRERYHQSCKCDVCGVFDVELLLYKNQTYCVRHLPVERITVVRKTKAGKHGSTVDYNKKVP